MIRNAKAKGSRNERRSKKLREAMGAIVLKAGASLGELDLVALYPELGWVEGIQVKSNGFPGSIEMQALSQLAERFGSRWRVTIDRWDDRKGVRHFKVTPTSRTITDDCAPEVP